MKKLLSILLAFCMVFSLCIDGKALDNNNTHFVGTQYQVDENGDVHTITGEMEDDGAYRVLVTCSSCVVECIRRGNILNFTQTNSDGTVKQWTTDLSADHSYLEDNSDISLLASQSIEGEAWGFSCYSDDTREDTEGLRWKMSSEEGTLMSFDQNNLTYRAYAENFWSNIISMNAAVREAKANMLSSELAKLNIVLNALFLVEGSLAAVEAALTSVDCSVRSALQWKTAREYANQANYYYPRYQSATIGGK